MKRLFYGLLMALTLLFPQPFAPRLDEETPTATETTTTTLEIPTETPTLTATATQTPSLTPTATATVTPPPTPTPHTSGYKYIPFTDGSRISYHVFSFSGWFNPATLALDINQPTVTALGDQVISITRSQCKKFTGYDLYVQHYHPLFIPDLPLISGAWQGKMEAMTGSGVLYMGEPLNEGGNFVVPPEPIITHFPVMGEVINGTSKVYKSCADMTVLNPAWQWKYRTISFHTLWGGQPWPDVVRTGLREFVTPGNDMVYNYTFAADVGITNYWYGVLNEANNTVNGWLYYAYLAEP